MKLTNKTLSITLLSVSIFQMSMVALAPILAALATAFPSAPQLAVQMAGSFLCLIMVLFALLANAISAAIGRRRMILTAMALMIAAAVGGTVLHSTLLLVYLWTTLVGASVGLFVPAVFSMMMDMYDDEGRTTVTSLQSMMVGVGGVVLSLLTGVLASKHWNNAFLAFLLAIPPLILSLRNIPSEEDILKSLPANKLPASETATAGYKDVPGFVWLAALQTFLFAILYFVFSTNISLYMAEKAYSSTSLMGAVTSVFMLGTCVSSLLLKAALGRFGRFTPAFATGLLALSYLVLRMTGALPLIFAAAFVGGSTLGFVFPFFVVTVGARVDASLSILASSLIISVAPNFGSFLSPLVITPLTGLFGGQTVGARFLLGAILAVLLAIGMILLSGSRKKV